MRDVALDLSYTSRNAPRGPRNASAEMPQSDRSPSPGEDQSGRRGLFSGRGRAVPDAVTADDAAHNQQLIGA
jgi:hypothetical protein